MEGVMRSLEEKVSEVETTKTEMMVTEAKSFSDFKQASSSSSYSSGSIGMGGGMIVSSVTSQQNTVNMAANLRKQFKEKEMEFEERLNELLIEKANLTRINSSLSTRMALLKEEVHIKEQQILMLKNNLLEINANYEALSVTFNQNLEELNLCFLQDRKRWDMEKMEFKLAIESLMTENARFKFIVSKLENWDVSCLENIKRSFFKVVEEINVKKEFSESRMVTSSYEKSGKQFSDINAINYAKSSFTMK
jgi:hypothetical protein